jgi:hypothetical protein
MNKDEYLRSMKQAIDESIKEDEKIQQFLVWLHEKTTALGSPYQESALRAFYCVVVEQTWMNDDNRKISRILDSNLDKDIHEVRGIYRQLMELRFNGIHCGSTREKIEIGQLLGRVKRIPTVDIVIDRDLALFCSQYKNPIEYLHRVTALLIGISSKKFQKQSEAIGFIFQKSEEKFLERLMSLTTIFSDREEQADRPSVINRENWNKSLRLLLFEYRNLRFDWQLSDEQKQLLNNYYAANMGFDRIVSSRNSIVCHDPERIRASIAGTV